MKKKVTCIICPVGCEISGSFRDGEIISIKGNKCEKGRSFARKEIINPKRILTTTIKINSRRLSRLPVRSSKPVPKDKILEFIKEIRKIKVSSEIKRGEIIAKNFLNSGADIISCTNVFG